MKSLLLQIHQSNRNAESWPSVRPSILVVTCNKKISAVVLATQMVLHDGRRGFIAVIRGKNAMFFLDFANLNLGYQIISHHVAMDSNTGLASLLPSRTCMARGRGQNAEFIWNQWDPIGIRF
jgi:hypothetical protein